MILNNYAPMGLESREVNQLIGNSTGWLDMLKKLTSPSMKITESSTNIANLIAKSNPYATMELRTNGLLIYFKESVSHSVWAIPYNDLTFFRANDQYAVYSDNEFCKFQVTPTLERFFAKVNQIKSALQNEISKKDNFMMPEA